MGFCGGAYDGVEESGLANVGEADDPGLEAHAEARGGGGEEAAPLPLKEERGGGARRVGG